MKNLTYCLCIISMMFLSIHTTLGQTILYSENFGIPATNTLIAGYANWQNKIVTYTGDGTCDVRNSNVSSGYAGASGGGNVMINNTTKWFQLSGINTVGMEDLKLSFGLRKNSTTEDGSNLVIQVSGDGIQWTKLPSYNSLSTGTGTTGWYHVDITGIPEQQNLYLRFSNLGTTDFRLDDLTITSTTILTTPSITLISPFHGGVYTDTVLVNLSLSNFVLGIDGLLKIVISGDEINREQYLNSTVDLGEYLATPLVLSPGNYNYQVQLLQTDSTVLSSEVAITASFSVANPTLSTPVFSPKGGTYFEPQSIQITCAESAIIYYTKDGTTPDQSAIQYTAPIIISESTTIKAIAFASGKEKSNIATASYIIRDTMAALSLPFDISKNSTTSQMDISRSNGFTSTKLGSAYADGGVKFEQSNAGNAILSAKLNDAPDTLYFELKGRVGGSAPQVYEGISFIVSESTDAINWTTIASLTEVEIKTTDYTPFYFVLNPESRHVKWQLVAATKGNTQLNNIRISKYKTPDIPIVIPDDTIHSDTTYIEQVSVNIVEIYPNPVVNDLTIKSQGTVIHKVEILNSVGNIIHSKKIQDISTSVSLRNYPVGIYFIRITTSEGIFVRKVLKQ